MRTKNARFWTFHHGSPVKLTLAPDEEIHLHASETHEEGFESTWTTYAYDGALVTQTCAFRARDCDGLMTGEEDYICPVGFLRSSPANAFIREGYPFIDGVPRWESTRSLFRDYSAERAGY